MTLDPAALALLGAPEYDPPAVPEHPPDGALYAAATDRGRRYVDLVCEGLPMAEAARRAGLSYGSSLRATYAPVVAERRVWLAQRAGVNALLIAAEHAKMAFANPQDVTDAEGRVLPLHELPRDVAASVASFEVVETEVNAELRTRTYKYKFHPKVPSLDAMARMFGLDAPQKVAITDTAGNDLPESDIDGARRIAFVLAQAARRADATGSVTDVEVADNV